MCVYMCIHTHTHTHTHTRVYLSTCAYIEYSLDSKWPVQTEECRRSYQRSASHSRFMKEAYNSAVPQKKKKKKSN